MISRGLSEEIAIEARLGYVGEPATGHEHYVGRLAIPYISKAGVDQLKFRCISDHVCKNEGHAKYLYSEGDQPRLYNVLAFLEPSDVICVTEGEIDALSVHHLAGVPAVGAPGVSSWRPFWNRLFVGHTRILVIADGDDPGLEFAKSLVSGNTKRDISPLEGASIVRMPTGLDANSFIVQEGVNAFRGRLGL